MGKADLLGPVSSHEEIERVLTGPSLMEEEPPELFLLDPGERVVDDGQHEVHEKVEIHGEVGDEEEGGPAAVRVGLHHHVWIATFFKRGE